jgi:hypothetical protein
MRKRNDPAWYVYTYSIGTIRSRGIYHNNCTCFAYPRAGTYKITIYYTSLQVPILYYIELNIVSRIYNTCTHTRARVQPRFAIIEKRFQFRIKYMSKALGIGDSHYNNKKKKKIKNLTDEQTK